MAQLLEGKPLAEAIVRELKGRVVLLKAPPVLAGVQVGVHAAIASYVQSQKRCAEAAGIEYRLQTLPQECTPAELRAHIGKLNADPGVHGIIVQMPLPQQLSFTDAARTISPEKDVEGVHPADICRLMFAETGFVPCTAAAVMELISSTGEELYGKEAVVVGHGKIVGKPIALMLLEKMATVTICHVATSDAGRLPDHVRRADILVSAVGKAGVIKGDWVKEGSVVIDVGITSVGGRLMGDVEFEEASRRAGYITPVPGGVGPLTTAVLMRNVVAAAQIQQA